MNIEEWVLIFSIIIYASTIALLMFFACKYDWQHPRWKFIVKKILDCVFIASLYLLTILRHGLCIKLGNQFCVNIWRDAFALLLMTLPGICFVLSSLNEISVLPLKINDKTTYIFIIMSSYTVLLFMFTIVNYGIYCMLPEGYTFREELGFWEIAFEFIYYTFSLMFTYSGGMIVASCVLTKTVEMIEIVTFFVSVGFILVELLGKMVTHDTNITKNCVKTRKAAQRIPCKFRNKRYHTGHIRCRKHAKDIPFEGDCTAERRWRKEHS